MKNLFGAAAHPIVGGDPFDTSFINLEPNPELKLTGLVGQPLKYLFFRDGNSLDFTYF